MYDSSKDQAASQAARIESVSSGLIEVVLVGVPRPDVDWASESAVARTADGAGEP